LRAPRRAPVSQAVPGSAGNRRGPRAAGVSGSSSAPASSSHMQWEVVETDHKRFRAYLHTWVQASGYGDLVTAQGEVSSVSGRRRVDNVLYVGRGAQRRYIVVEFDKEQHKGYSIDRDVKLLQEWYMDRLAGLWPQGATIDVVRWNPNSYSHADGQLGEADTPARLEKLQAVLCELLDGERLHPGTMVVHYLYYTYDRLRRYQQDCGRDAGDLVLYGDNGERMSMEHRLVEDEQDDDLGSVSDEQ
jgi:hypothetical protein